MDGRPRLCGRCKLFGVESLGNTCPECNVPRKHRSLAQGGAAGGAAGGDAADSAANHAGGAGVGRNAGAQWRRSPHSNRGSGERLERYTTLRSDSVSPVTGTSWSAAQKNTGGLLQWAYDEIGIEEHNTPELTQRLEAIEQYAPQG